MSVRKYFKILINEFSEFNFPPIIPRELQLPASKRIMTLIGPRRAGKTFYFYQLITALLDAGVPKSYILYINFEDDRIFPLELKDLNDLLDAYYEMFPDTKEQLKYFFFDEIQNVKDWEMFVRRISDKENVVVHLTGSSSKLLSKEIATHLRGRTLPFYLFPLSFREFLLFKGISLPADFAYAHLRYSIQHLLPEYLEFGGFPEVVQTDTLKHPILTNYYDLILYKDLVDRFAIRNTILLRTLLKFLITNIASPFSATSCYNSLRQQIKVSKETILEYLSYFSDVNLIFLVPIFSYSLKVQQVNPSKIYCIDTGLRNAVAFKFSKDEGRLAENIVFIELKRRNYPVYYWKGKHEVDFVIQKGDGSLLAINVCFSDTIDPREIQGLLEFRTAFAPREPNLLIITQNLEGESEEIPCIPLWNWLLTTD